MEQMPPYGSGMIKVKCQKCGKDMITIVGKRDRKYCSNSCRQKAYQSANKVEMISISKVEYDRLTSADIKAKGFKERYDKAVKDGLFTKMPEYPMAPEFKERMEKQHKEADLAYLKNIEVNTKQKRLYKKDEAVNKIKTHNLTGLDVKCHPQGLSKSDLAMWRRNNK